MGYTNEVNVSNNSTGQPRYSFRASVTELEQDIANNRTKVKIVFQAKGINWATDSRPQYDSHTEYWKIWVDGVLKSGNPSSNGYPQALYNSYKNIGTVNNLWIDHNADGSKSISIKVQLYLDGSPDYQPNSSPTFNAYRLTTINRGLFRLHTPDNTWKTGQAYIKPGDNWKLGQVFINTPSGWKRGI